MKTTFEIYKPCLDCEHASFIGRSDFASISTNVRCDHSDVCAMIDGEEPALYTYVDKKGNVQVVTNG